MKLLDDLARRLGRQEDANPERVFGIREAGLRRCRIVRIVGLSNVENALAVIFCILSLPVDLEIAKSLFADQGTLERKLKLINFSVLVRTIRGNKRVERDLQRAEQSPHLHRCWWCGKNRTWVFFASSLGPGYAQARGRALRHLTGDSFQTLELEFGEHDNVELAGIRQRYRAQARVSCPFFAFRRQILLPRRCCKGRKRIRRCRS